MYRILYTQTDRQGNVRSKICGVTTKVSLDDPTALRYGIVHPNASGFLSARFDSKKQARRAIKRTLNYYKRNNLFSLLPEKFTIVGA